MSTWDLLITPTVTLSLILESEAPSPSLSRWLSSWTLWFRPRFLASVLRYELEVRGGGVADNGEDGEGDGVVSAGTLRVVDYSLVRDSGGAALDRATRTRPAAVEHLSMTVSSSEGIDVTTPEHSLLLLSLSRVLACYKLVDRVIDLAATPYPTASSNAGEARAEAEEGKVSKEEADELLRELWRILRPERELPGLVGKHWQELGFQNTSPTTDFRGVGMLGLHVLLHFARTYGDRAAEMVDESVGGGEHWYPLALASLHMTSFSLELAKSRDLQLFLLRSFQTPSSSSVASSSFSTSFSAFGTTEPQSFSSPDGHDDGSADAAPLLSFDELGREGPSETLLRARNGREGARGEGQAKGEGKGEGKGKEGETDIEPFLRIAGDLLLLFHAHWKQGGWTVMNFEQVSRAFQASLRPWIRRGVLDGRALGWEKWEEGGVKLE